MRKILLGTTAVVGAALMSVNVAQAQTAPTVRVGGYFEFTGGWVDDNFDRPNATGLLQRRNRVDFRSDMEINIFVTGKAANGLSYGAQIELQMDNVTNQGSANAGSGTIVDTDEMWGFISSPTLGTLQFGDQDNAADQIRVTVPSVTNLGESGGWDEFVAQGADGNRYILTTMNDGNDSSKIIYLSPQFFGFDFGVSYGANSNEGENYLSPNATNTFGNNGSNALQRNATNALRNEVSYGVRYRGSFGNVGFAAGFGGQRGDAAAGSGLRDPYAWQTGANLSAFGFTAGIHYIWGAYGGSAPGRTGILPGLDNSTNLSLGLTYVTGPFSVGGFWSRGTRDNGVARFSAGDARIVAVGEREQTAWGFGAVYTLAPGLEVFANYTHVKDENLRAVNANAAPVYAVDFRNRDIDVIIIGTRLAF